MTQTQRGHREGQVSRGEQDLDACPGQRAVLRLRPLIVLVCALGPFTPAP